MTLTATPSPDNPRPRPHADVVRLDDHRRSPDDARTPDQRRRDMIARLMNLGLLTDKRLAAALQTLPRHMFASRFDVVTDNRRHRHSTVYDDLGSTARAMEALHDLHTSPVISRHLDTTPELVMPSPIDVVRLLQPAQLNRTPLRTLHIGTGTGYTAGLITLLTGNVVTVERDAAIYERAHELMCRSRQIGLRTTLLGDGSDGAAKFGAYERVISSCDVARVPGAWLRQTMPGGRIVTTVAGQPIALTVDDNNTATGAFADGRPMPMPTPLLAPDWVDPAPKLAELAALAHRGGRPLTMPDGKWMPTVPAQGLEHPVMRWLLALVMPHVHMSITDGAYLLLDPRTSSWAHAVPGTREVSVGGVDTHLWMRVYNLWSGWARAALPSASEFTLTVTAHGEHYLTPPQGDLILLDPVA